MKVSDIYFGDGCIEDVVISGSVEEAINGLNNQGEINVMDMHREELKSNIRRLIDYVGDDYSRSGVIDTPDRVMRMYDEVFDGYRQSPYDILQAQFDENHDELVIVRNIEFYSHCEHHMVPFFGKAHIGYIPQGKVVGLSKLARLTNCFAHRLQIQERLTSQIADAIWTILNPLGVMVVIEADHMCMKMRGVKNPCADTVTSAVRGVFRDKAECRSEFLSLIKE